MLFVMGDRPYIGDLIIAAGGGGGAMYSSGSNPTLLLLDPFLREEERARGENDLRDVRGV